MYGRTYNRGGGGVCVCVCVCKCKGGTELQVVQLERTGGTINGNGTMVQCNQQVMANPEHGKSELLEESNVGIIKW